MPRTLPLLALIAIDALAGCTGGLGLGGSSDDPTTTTTTSTSTEQTQTPTSTPVATITETTTRTTTQTPSTTTQATTRVTTIPTRTTARVDAPKGSDRFEARVTKIVDPTTVKIERNGKTQTADPIGVRVRDSGLIHKRVLQKTRERTGRFNRWSSGKPSPNSRLVHSSQISRGER